MKRSATLLAGAALLVAGCHRPRADQPILGAAADAQAATAAKTLADLQAADEASRGPPPEIAPVVAPPPRPASAPAHKVVAATTDESPSVPAEESNQAER